MRISLAMLGSGEQGPEPMAARSSPMTSETMKFRIARGIQRGGEGGPRSSE